MTKGAVTVDPLACNGTVRGSVEDIAWQAVRGLAKDGQTRRRLPGGGKLFMEGRTPFVAVYVEPDRFSDPGTFQLATALRSYMVLPRGRADAGRRVLEILLPEIEQECGAALVLQIWSSQDGLERTLRLHVGRSADASDLARRFSQSLAGIRVIPADQAPPAEDRALTEVVGSGDDDVMASDSVRPLVTGSKRWLGLEVPSSLFRSSVGEVFPGRLAGLRRTLSEGLEGALADWAATETDLEVAHRFALGRRSLDRAARGIDTRLAEVARSFDLVLGASPVNVQEMWADFEAHRRERAPRFQYRPLTFDPEALKRALFRVPLELIEDPLVAQLIREKQEELDLRISMLRNRGRPDFLLGSIELFGTPDPELVDVARALLDDLSSVAKDDGADARRPVRTLDSSDLLRMATSMLQSYRVEHDDFPQTVEVRDDISAGMLVSAGTLCISATLKVHRARAEALLEHEIGTHVLTYFNGTRQPLRLLASGLARYGALQEGLAVLAEYLVGGLTRSRVRTLAARVVAVDARVEGADFVETFRRLVALAVPSRQAFAITLRVFRGGGLTKDHQYLGGLTEVLRYLRAGGDLDTLFLGKIGLSHIHIVDQLALRGILRPPVAKPRYVDREETRGRLERATTMSVLDLLKEARP